jgi:hypothetical protein
MAFITFTATTGGTRLHRTRPPPASSQPPAPPPAQPAQDQPAPLYRRVRDVLAPLFPAAPAYTSAAVLAQILAAAAAAGVLLLRQSGHPAWQTAWAEDRTVFLPRALLDPWGSFVHCYGGYVQLVPQLVADVVTRFPLRDAAAGFAVTGAAAASGCALFVFHASAGHVRQPALRGLLAASVVLLPVAVIEVASNGVDAPWYLMYALFWAVLWRPATRAGAGAAALVAFLAMASNILNLLYLPLVAARALVLPRPREQAVTAGWLAGVGYQLAGILVGAPAILGPGQPRQLATPGAIASFYGQHVLVAAVAGWRLAVWLTAAAGPGWLVVISSCLLLAAGAWAVARGGARVRLFVTAALVTGLVLTAFPVLIRFWVTQPVSAQVSRVWLPGSRFTVCPVLLIDAAAVVAVDARLRQGRARLGSVLAVLLLVVGLGTGWLTSFRYPNMRSTAPLWQQTSLRFDRLCRQRRPAAEVELYPAASPQARSPVPCADADPGVVSRGPR